MCWNMSTVESFAYERREKSGVIKLIHGNFYEKFFLSVIGLNFLISKCQLIR
jgi:hypothetical protein